MGSCTSVPVDEPLTEADAVALKELKARVWITQGITAAQLQVAYNDALINAALAGNVKCMRYMASYAKFNCIGKDNTNVLSAAVFSNNIYCVRFALERSSNVAIFSKNNDGNTPLLRAMSLEIAELLVSRGAQHTVEGSASTLLLNACMSGNLDFVKYVWELNPSDLNRCFPNGTSPLFCAASGGHTDIVQFLLSAGLIQTGQEPAQTSPFNIAAYNGHLETVKVLYATSFYAGMKMTALCTAISHKQSAVALYLLTVCSKADIESCVIFGQSVLLQASALQLFDVVNRLIKMGVNVNVASPSNKATALICAAEKGADKTVKMFIVAGAAINAQTITGGTALLLAAQNGHVETVKLMIEAAAEMELKGREGLTALHSACCNGHLECAQLLVAAGAKVDPHDDLGRTPLTLAFINGKVNLVGFLESAGASVEFKALAVCLQWAKDEFNKWVAGLIADRIIKLLIKVKNTPLSPEEADTVKQQTVSELSLLTVFVNRSQVDSIDGSMTVDKLSDAVATEIAISIEGAVLANGVVKFAADKFLHGAEQQRKLIADNERLTAALLTSASFVGQPAKITYDAAGKPQQQSNVNAAVDGVIEGLSDAAGNAIGEAVGGIAGNLLGSLVPFGLGSVAKMAIKQGVKSAKNASAKNAQAKATAAAAANQK